MFCNPCKKQLESKGSWEGHKKSKTHRFHIKTCDYGVDGATTIIGPSKLLPGQNGLFAGENIDKGAIITWYLGVNFSTPEQMEERIKVNGKGTEYVLDVSDGGGSGEVEYQIDGWKLEGEGIKSNAVYINHDNKSPNVEFKYMRRPNAFKGAAVAIVAVKNIKIGEELFVDYGDNYHEGLVESGKFVERKN